MHPFLNIADRAARMAGKTILDGLKRLDRIRMQEKQDNRGVVTEIDLKAESIIIDTIIISILTKIYSMLVMEYLRKKATPLTVKAIFGLLTP